MEAWWDGEESLSLHRGTGRPGGDAFRHFATSKQHWCHIRTPAKASGGKNSLPSRNPSEIYTRDYPINISSYAHWGGGDFSSQCTSVATTGGCRRWPASVVPPHTHTVSHTHISLAELSAVMTDLLCLIHPFALPTERNAAQRSIRTFHLCCSPSIVNNCCWSTDGGWQVII